MSTWLSSFSLANRSNPDSDDGKGDGNDQNNKPPTSHHVSPTSGVKQDLSALSATFSHHLRGVAAFLAPPPAAAQILNNTPVNNDYTSRTTTTEDDYATASSSNSETIIGIKKDLAEIGGSFKSLFSSSSDKPLSGISKFAYNILQFHQDDAIDDDEEEEEDIAGINEEVVDFVRKISLRPELWTDFPLSLPNGFYMSDNQREHAVAIEDLVPSLVTLRQTCSHLSNGQFWMIYFILLLPRLNETDLDLLSTSKIIEVRETLLQKLQNKRNAQVETSGISETVNTSSVSQEISVTKEDESLPEQKDVSAETADTTGDSEIETVKTKERFEDEDAGQGKSLNGQKHSENVDDVSFSDLEDDGNDLSERLTGIRRTQSGRGSSASESNEWVRLTENSEAQGGQNNSGFSTKRGKDSEGEESNDWLAVDDIDLDNLAAA
ncbi:hypothetical protein ACH5RR_004361 [Cinchona calisaya]|uniref:BSD domain-containing protein n=1 Tax=Cinchona calisaya TaxID=153742 RepID=A0ABD3AXB5_9GENT